MPEDHTAFKVCLEFYGGLSKQLRKAPPNQVVSEELLQNIYSGVRLCRKRPILPYLVSVTIQLPFKAQFVSTTQSQELTGECHIVENAEVLEVIVKQNLHKKRP